LVMYPSTLGFSLIGPTVFTFVPGVIVSGPKR
jgi:hypothetical protein